MAAAIEVGEYLIAHALATFGFMGADPRLEAAVRIGRWIVTGYHATFTKRDVLRALRGQSVFTSVDRVTAGLAVLEEHGWVRPLPSRPGPGRPSSRYEANPSVFVAAGTKPTDLSAEAPTREVLSISSMDSGQARPGSGRAQRGRRRNRHDRQWSGLPSGSG